MNPSLHLLAIVLPACGLLLRLTRARELFLCASSLISSLGLLALGGGPTTDELSLWLLPFIATVYLAVLLAMPRAERSVASSRRLLMGQSLHLAFVSVQAPMALAALWLLTLFPLALELQSPRLRRIFACYHGLSCVAFTAGATALALSPQPPLWGLIAIVVAIVLRNASMPLHQWLPALFEKGPLGPAIAFCAPQLGAYAALRLLSPHSPEALLVGLGGACLVTSVYAACLAIGARSVRGAYAGLFLGQTSLVFAGLQCTSEAGLAGGLALWISGGLAMTGLGLAIWALEARRGPSALDVYSGGYDKDPILATCFLIFGLASVGFPGTLGFVSEELMLDGTTQLYPHVGILAAVASCLNGITVLRAYFCLFCGTRVSARNLAGGLRLRERVALLTLVGLLLGFGLHPQTFVASRWLAAHEVLQQREAGRLEANSTSWP